MIMKKGERIILISMSILLFIISVLLILFSKPKINVMQLPERRVYSKEECKKVDFEIENIKCFNKTMIVKIKNTGNISIDDDFVGVFHSPNMLVLVGGAGSGNISINKSSSIYFNIGKSVEIKKIEIVFQPCPFATKVIENISIEC